MEASSGGGLLGWQASGGGLLGWRLVVVVVYWGGG